MKNLLKLASSTLFDEQETIHFDNYVTEDTPELGDVSTTTSPENPPFNEDPDILLESDDNLPKEEWKYLENDSKLGESLQDLCLENLFHNNAFSVPKESNPFSGADSIFQTSQKTLLSADQSYSTLPNSFSETLKEDTKKKSLSFAGIKRQFKKIYLTKQGFKDNTETLKLKNESQEFPKEKISNPISIEGRPSLASSGKADKFCLIKDKTIKASETPSYNMFAKYKEDDRVSYTKPKVGSTAESFEKMTARLFEGVNVVSF
ncbi:unnamed protein product [Rhizopus stolonifer]